jgi:hypothetical protein
MRWGGDWAKGVPASVASRARPAASPAIIQISRLEACLIIKPFHTVFAARIGRLAALSLQKTTEI